MVVVGRVHSGGLGGWVSKLTFANNFSPSSITQSGSFLLLDQLKAVVPSSFHHSVIPATDEQALCTLPLTCDCSSLA